MNVPLPHAMRSHWLTCCLWASLLFAPALGATREEGEINGARFTILYPTTSWNGNVLLHAHGRRDETSPLVADLFPEQLAYKTLLDEGWILATTSYRRNGIIIADAIDDLDQLRRHLIERRGTPKRVIVEGESMGALIAVLLAEREPGDYHGVVAHGPALHVRENNRSTGLTLAPKIPVLFVCTRLEVEAAKAYVFSAREQRAPDVVRPHLVTIAREGHINVNQAERLYAFRALTEWIERGTSPLLQPSPGERWADATQPPEPGPSQVTFDADERGFSARITEISAVYGNLWINAQPGDFERIGLGKGAYFQATLNGQTFRVRYGNDFSSVERGQWVAFGNADGFFWLARNYGHAASTVGAKLGDSVQFRRYPATETPPSN